MSAKKMRELMEMVAGAEPTASPNTFTRTELENIASMARQHYAQLDPKIRGGHGQIFLQIAEKAKKLCPPRMIAQMLGPDPDDDKVM